MTRHGKFLDVIVGGLHLVIHLARGGWIRWRDEVPTLPPRPGGKNPLAARVVLDDQSGLDITEAGTKKRLAIYVVRDPQDVPGIASLGPDPLTDDFTLEKFRDDPRGRGPQADQGRAPPPGHHRRHRQRLLRRDPARRPDVAVQARRERARGAGGDDTDLVILYDAIRVTLGDAVERSRGLAASELKGEKKSNLAVHGRTGQACPVCGDTVREVSFADSSLQYCPTCQTGGKPLADRRMSKLLK